MRRYAIFGNDAQLRQAVSLPLKPRHAIEVRQTVIPRPAQACPVHDALCVFRTRFEFGPCIDKPLALYRASVTG